MNQPFDLELLCEQARARLRRSVAIRVGIAKVRIAQAFAQHATQAEKASRERELQRGARNG